jgi:hypothetical protein
MAHYMIGTITMADITYYVALSFTQDDSGETVAGEGEEFQSAGAAIRRAESLSRMAGMLGALAFSRTGDPLAGEFKDAQVLRSFGSVPSDLSGL